MPHLETSESSSAFAALWRRPLKRGWNFARAWLRSPRSVGAVMPSSPALARAVATQVDVSRPGAVIELGPGTGVVTKALLHHGVGGDRLFLVERDERLAAMLSSQFTGLTVICGDAMRLSAILPAQATGQVNAVVSSLPVIGMPKEVRHAIEAQMAMLAGENGRIVQFTYGPQSPISEQSLKALGLRGRRVKIVVANVPPAHVWVYEKVSGQ